MEQADIPKKGEDNKQKTPVPPPPVVVVKENIKSKNSGTNTEEHIEAKKQKEWRLFHPVI
jgi:hypothetical protein